MVLWLQAGQHVMGLPVVVSLPLVGRGRGGGRAAGWDFAAFAHADPAGLVVPPPTPTPPHEGEGQMIGQGGVSGFAGMTALGVCCRRSCSFASPGLDPGGRGCPGRAGAR